MNGPMDNTIEPKLMTHRPHSAHRVDACDVASGQVKGGLLQGQSDAYRPRSSSFSTAVKAARSAGTADALAQLYRDNSSASLRRSRDAGAHALFRCPSGLRAGIDRRNTCR